MAYVRNIIFNGCKYFKPSKKGIFSTSYETKKLFSVIPKLEYRICVNVLFQNTIMIPSKGFSSEKSVYDRRTKKFTIQIERMLNKFKHLHLGDLIENPNKFNESALIALFHKMCVVYHINKRDTKFVIHLPHMLESAEFRAFCTLLEQKLPKLPPDVFVFLLNLKLFKVPVNCILMRRIFTLILENFNCLSLCDILEMYIGLKDRYYENSEECKNIIKVCEVYFEKTFEDELSHCILYEDLVYFLSAWQLPLNVRKFIAERLLEYLDSSNFRPLVSKKFFRFLFETPFFPSLRDRALKIFQDIIVLNFSSKILQSYCFEYRIAVTNNKDHYDEETCKVLAENSLRYHNVYDDLVICMEHLCSMGYFHENLFNRTLDIILEYNSNKWRPELAYKIASILVQIKFHEMNNPNLKRLREILLSYDAEKAYSHNFLYFIRWAEFLTFLGCDTRDLLSKIFSFPFTRKQLKSLTNAECRCFVQLHHFAKEHFSDGYTTLSDNLVDMHLERAKFPSTVFSPSPILEFFGGEDYVLQNCTTAQKYFIPLAVILGPDNKPINLSSAKQAFEETLENRKYKGHNTVSVNFKIEDIARPPDSKVISFIGYCDPQPLKFRNVPMLSGIPQILMKSYQSIQYDTVLIPLKLLKSHPEETVKYLQSQIDEIIQKPRAQTIKN